MDKFTSRRLIFQERSFICAPDGASKKTGAQNQIQCARLIEKQLKTTIFGVYYLNSACSFHFYCNFIKNFCNEALTVRMLFEFLK